MSAPNHHATVILAGDRGIMITGRSGSGKTTLGLALLDHCSAHGIFGRLVADDQVYITPSEGRTIVEAPRPIAGLVEIYGPGPSPIAHEPRAVVDLAVCLVETEDAPRLTGEERLELAGAALPCLRLAAKSTRGGVIAVAARLRLPPFR